MYRAIRSRQRGTATVELAMVLPVLVFLLFGIIEFGLMVKDVVGLNQAAREGARCAVVGATLATIGARIDASAPTIDTSQLTELYEYRSYDADYGTWSSWTVLGETEGHNNASDGDQVRITLHYPHPLVTGGIFAYLADADNPGTIGLGTAIIMRRE